jgi:hypothetical protein
VLRSSILPRRVALPLLAAAMLWLQALGLWHGVLHARGHDTPSSVHAGGGGTLADHDEGSDECRLYDQLAHADLACSAPAALAEAELSLVPDAPVPAGRLAPQAAGFLARGPPGPA